MEKKVAIVTGASRGIGYAIAKNMVRDGYITCIMDLRSEEDAKENLDALREAGEVFYYCGSTTSADDRNTFVAEIMQRYGRIDVLVNNAGVAPRVRQDLLSATEESFDFVVGVNVKGTMFLSQAVANEMLKQPVKENGVRAIIVNISSFSATVSSPNRPEYCISKAGVSMLTKLFADRLAAEGIYVYEVQPGVIQTDMLAVVDPEIQKELAEETPLMKLGTPSDIAKSVCFLCSPAANFITGQVLGVNGGFVI